MLTRRRLNKEQAFQKLKHYCAYQDRCRSEVMTKAFSFGLPKELAEEVVGKLSEEGYFQEQRFAAQFASGRFRLKKWGKTRIAAELKKKKISKTIIDDALYQINEADYLKTLEKLAKTKWNGTTGPGTNLFVKMSKTRNYLLQKGYETALVNKELAKLSLKEKGAEGRLRI